MRWKIVFIFLHECMPAPTPTSYYLLPSTLTASPAIFWCGATGKTTTVCGSSGCLSGCQDVSATADNNTATFYKAGAYGAYTLQYCFSSPVLPQSYTQSMSNKYHDRTNWTVYSSSSASGPFTLKQTFTVVEGTTPRTLYFNPPTTTAASCWKLVTNSESTYFYMAEAYWSAIFCPYGYYLLPTLLGCTPCPAGTYGASWGTGTSQSLTCASCSTGKYATAGSSACTLCQAGAYSSTAGTSSCQSCSAGAYSSATGMTNSATCKLCTPGTYSTTLAAPAVATCVNCSGGSYSSASGLPSASGCVSCNSGKYSNATAATAVSTCQNCSSGSYSPALYLASSSGCIICTSGTYSSALAAASVATCQNCIAGTYASALGMVSSSGCAQCSPGKYAPSAGSSVCTACSMGTFCNVSGASTCLVCPSGSFSNATGLSSCFQCAKTGCVCPAGSYGTTAVCFPCPAGTYSSNAGASICQTCSVCSATQITLTTCAQGSTYNATTCTCGAGTYGNTTCTPCPAGTFSPSNGASACHSCAGCGAFQLAVTTCPQGGTYDSSSCTCALGAYGTPSSCSPCLAGTYSSASGAATCQTCAGCDPTQVTLTSCQQGSTYDSSACTCGPGTFGTSTCAQCLAGTFSNVSGASACLSCVGCDPSQVTLASCKQGSTNDSSSCTCGPGTYGNSTCFQCPAGKFSATNGLAVCQSCSGCDPTQIDLSPCQIGGVSDTTSCTCDVNTYGATSCTQCPPNTVAPQGSQTALACRCQAGYICSYTKRLSVTLVINFNNTMPPTNPADLLSSPVIASLAQSLGIPVSSIQVVSITPVTQAPSGRRSMGAHSVMVTVPLIHEARLRRAGHSLAVEYAVTVSRKIS